MPSRLLKSVAKAASNGWQGRPDGSALTEGAVDAMDIGSNINAAQHTGLDGYYADPGSGNPDDLSLEPDAVGSDDGTFTDSNTKCDPDAVILIIDIGLSDTHA